MKKSQFNAAVEIASKPVLPILVNFTLMCVQNAILFIPVSKKCWIRLAVLINSVRNTVCLHNRLSLKNSFQKNALYGRFFYLQDEVYAVRGHDCMDVGDRTNQETESRSPKRHYKNPCTSFL